MLDFLEKELAELARQGLLREVTGARLDLIDVASNDYLAHARTPVSRATLLECEAAEAGAGASRLIHGTTQPHLALEAELASWVGLPSALLFSSGYAANLGLLQALARPGDRVVSDALNHASIIDGCRLARADVAVVPHRDLAAVEGVLAEPAAGARRFVVTESYFSMDGDQADLPGLRRLCDRFGASLLVDEAHALGVFWPEGAGLCRATGVVPDALVGTLGKAIGVHGAFVAGSGELRRWLWNRARSLVFSTASSPLLALIALEQVRRARRDEAGRSRLAQAAAQLRARLRAAGVEAAPGSTGPIVPILLGDNARALRVADALQRDGFRAQAIRPPTVPAGSARLRITVSTALDDATLERLATCLIAACAE
ncbi:MAG: 8-amino-7-oxononanoate synthase [Sorangiineae bacterium PRO1]|nr:8-amino-7-oxononanoate synthase [Sorangiineae bacterium PRO1]